MSKIVEHPVGSILGEEEIAAVRRVIEAGQGIKTVIDCE